MSWISRLVARRPCGVAPPEPPAAKPSIMTLNDPDCDLDAVAAFLKLPAEEQMRQLGNQAPDKEFPR